MLVEAEVHENNYSEIETDSEESENEISCLSSRNCKFSKNKQ